MTRDATASPESNAPPAGSGFVLPLVVSTVLALFWGGYTIWVSLEILSLHP